MSDRGRGTTDDRWVRETLADAVADVEPRSGLADVHARLERRGGGTRTRAGWAAAVGGLAVAATVAAVALATGLGDDDEPTGPAASPSVTTEQTPATQSPSDGETLPRYEGPLPVYYVGETPTGPRLYREFRAPDTERGDALATAVQMAVSLQPYDPDYRVPWPRGTKAEATYDAAADLLTIDMGSGGTDLRARPAGMSPDEAGMALQQLIHTAQAAVQARAPVQFLLDGEVTDRLLGEPASEPLAEGDPMEVQAPVWVITPPDDVASNVFLVQGRGAFFEATVAWQVLQDGEVVKEGSATAEECCVLSPFSFEITGVPPGDYLLRVYDADVSGGEGPGEHEDTKRFTLTG